MQKNETVAFGGSLSEMTDRKSGTLYILCYQLLEQRIRGALHAFVRRCKVWISGRSLGHYTLKYSSYSRKRGAILIKEILS